MLQINGLGKTYRGVRLFRSLDFQINAKDRIGRLYGTNTGIL